MAGILEMIQELITKFFGGSAMTVIRSMIEKILDFVGSIFGRLSPSAR